MHFCSVFSKSQQSEAESDVDLHIGIVVGGNQSDGSEECVFI